ncbi:MAG: hypothetical protein V1798_00765 [Pseudomonadota bacterium]
MAGKDGKWGRRGEGKPYTQKFINRVYRIQGEHPEMSFAEAMAMARAAHRVTDPEAKARQIANLNRRGRAKKKGPRPMPGDSGASAGIAHVPVVDIVEFATGAEWLGMTLYPGQEVLLRAFYGLPIPESLMGLYREMTGLERVYEDGVAKRVAVWVIGRRGTKSTCASIIACYEATVRAGVWRARLQPGERAFIVIVCTRQRSAEDVVQAGCARLLENAGSALKGVVEDAWKAELKLKTGVTIASFPTNSTAPRGLACPVAILDEVAFFAQEGPKADELIYNAIRPGQAQFGHEGKVLLISSPLSKDGLLYSFYQEGPEIPGRLTVRASTMLMNPSVPAEFIAEERARNPESAAREYDAEFCERIQGIFTEPLVEQAMTLAEDNLRNQRWQYVGALDASGLHGRDRTAFAVAHREDDGVVVLDYSRTWGAGNPDEVYREIGQAARIYGVFTVWIDRYAHGFVASLLQGQGLTAEIRPAATSAFLTLKSLMLGGKVRLPMNPDLKRGLLRTQLAISRGGHPTIFRERDSEGHGDLADSCATACWACNQLTETEEIVIYDAVERDAILPASYG